MNIEIKKRNNLLEAVRMVKDKSEDKIFDILLRFPTDRLPASVSIKIDNYLNKRLHQLQHESVKLNWHNVQLKQAVKEIQSRQQS